MKKIFYKIWVTIFYLLIPFGIYLVFNVYIEKYLNEYVLINTATETTGRIADYRIEKENVENDETHETGVITHFICDVEFVTERNEVINNKVDVSKSDFEKIKNQELQIVYVDKNPHNFQIINLETLLTKSEWFWKRFTLILIFGFSIIVAIIFAFYKGYRFDFEG